MERQGRSAYFQSTAHISVHLLSLSESLRVRFSFQYDELRRREDAGVKSLVREGCRLAFDNCSRSRPVERIYPVHPRVTQDIEEEVGPEIPGRSGEQYGDGKGERTVDGWHVSRQGRRVTVAGESLAIRRSHLNYCILRWVD